MAANKLEAASTGEEEQDGDRGGSPGKPVSGHEEDGTIVWRYPEMCAHWGVSRATVERWVRRYERTGDGIPVRRDPSGRPYWLAGEAAADVQPLRAEPARLAFTDHERLDGLRRVAARGRRVS